MATTPQQVITNALVILGVTFPGQDPSPSMLADSFTRLNNMLASWTTERLIVYGIETLDFDFVTDTNSYTIGPTGTFAGARPNSIDSAQVIVSDLGLRFPLRQITTAEWNMIEDRSATSAIPKVMYDNYEYPNSTLYFWPTPVIVGEDAASLELQVWQALEQFVTLADSFDMPPGYERAITYNLACEMDMVYGRPTTPDAERIAMESKNSLKEINAPPTHVSGMGEEAVARGQVAQGAGPLLGDAVSPIKR